MGGSKEIGRASRGRRRLGDDRGIVGRRPRASRRDVRCGIKNRILAKVRYWRKPDRRVLVALGGERPSWFRRASRSSIDLQLRVAHSLAPFFYFQLDPGAELIRCRASSSIVSDRDQSLT